MSTRTIIFATGLAILFLGIGGLLRYRQTIHKRQIAKDQLLPPDHVVLRVDSNFESPGEKRRFIAFCECRPVEDTLFSYKFREVPFFQVYDSLRKHWKLYGGYPTTIRDHAYLLKLVNLSVSKASRGDILCELFKGQPLLKYDFDADRDCLTIFTDKIDLFIKAQ